MNGISVMRVWVGSNARLRECSFTLFVDIKSVRCIVYKVFVCALRLQFFWVTLLVRTAVVFPFKQGIIYGQLLDFLTQTFHNGSKWFEVTLIWGSFYSDSRWRRNWRQSMWYRTENQRVSCWGIFIWKFISERFCNEIIWGWTNRKITRARFELTRF